MDIFKNKLSVKLFLLSLFVFQTINIFSESNGIIRFFDAYTEMNKKNRKAIWDFLVGQESDQDPLDQDGQNNQDNIDYKDPFDQVVGIPADIIDLASLINNPSDPVIKNLGIQVPKGILLYGPPGTGKTSIARALAKKVNAAFISATGSEFVEIYVGVGPQRVRALFERAEEEIRKGSKNVIIFIDEIDAIGKRRMHDSHDSEYRNTLNALLDCMDGFKKNAKGTVIVIGATNTPEDLDPALKRSGRFDKLVKVGFPDLEGRKKLFQLYMGKKPCFEKDINFEKLAKETSGLTGADIENIVEQSVGIAYRNKVAFVSEKDVEGVIADFIKQSRLRK